MNIEMQKKWFVYVGDHHEGPFSAEDLQKKLEAKFITDESYIWCEGMADWQMLSTVPALVFDAPSEEQPSSFAAAEDKIDKKADSKKENKSEKKTSKKKKELSLAKMGGIAAAVFALLIVLGIASLSIMSRLSSGTIHATIRPTLIQLVDRFSFLSGAFKLIPQLADVKPEDQKELEEAQIGLPENGVKLAIALSQNDPIRPFFYFSTNFPHKTKLDVLLVGTSETLLNRLQYSTQLNATALHGFSRTEVIQAEGGQPLPKGEYRIFVTESENQEPEIANLIAQYTPVKPAIVETGGPLPSTISNGAHFIFTKTVFLGGERDEVYLTRLKAFHEKVKQNADKELTELKQYSDTLLLQYNTLNTEFGKIYRSPKIGPLQKNNWKKTANTWKQINGQLEQTIQSWTKDTLQNEYFYGKAYELVKSCFESLKNLFTLENAYVEQPGDRSSFEIQHGKALSEAREAAEVLRAKTDLLMKAPKSPGGLPTREGL